jgi:hypothetical protein
MTNQVDYAGEWDVIVGADDTLTLSGNLSSGSAGNSGIDKDGLGTLVLSGANTYKGKRESMKEHSPLPRDIHTAALETMRLWVAL